MPLEIARAGSVPLTAVIHPDVAERWVWRMYLPAIASRQWPGEAGGDDTLSEIRRICAEPDRPHTFDPDHHDPRWRIDKDVERLIQPERQRLLEEMKAAIRRMLAIAYA
jgi:hypothetical protein